MARFRRRFQFFTLLYIVCVSPQKCESRAAQITSSDLVTSSNYAQISRSGITAQPIEELSGESKVMRHFGNKSFINALNVSATNPLSDISHIFSYYPQQDVQRALEYDTTDIEPNGRSYGNYQSKISSTDTYNNADQYSSKNKPFSKADLLENTAQDRYVPRPKKGSGGSNSGSYSIPDSSSSYGSSYQSDMTSNAGYKPFHDQAEPPPYPPLSTEGDTFKSTFDMYSDLADTYDKPNVDESSDSDLKSDSYKPAKFSPDLMYSSYKPFKPDTDGSYLSYMPSMSPKPNKQVNNMVYKPSKPMDADMGYDYIPPKTMKKPKPDKENNLSIYGTDSGNSFLPYSPSDGDADQPFPIYKPEHSQHSEHSEHDDDISDDSDQQHYPVYKPSSPHVHDDSNDEDSFPYEEKPSSEEDNEEEMNDSGSSSKKPKHNQMKPYHHVYEPPKDDDSKTQPKHKPPSENHSPQIYFSKPPKDVYKPMHDYDSYFDHELDHDEEHKEDHKEEHKDHDSDYRVSKKPYSYYYLGRKLWYIPLYFSVYFIIYVTALILKSIARHKINYPITHWSTRSLGKDNNFEEISANVTKTLNNQERHFM